MRLDKSVTGPRQLPGAQAFQDRGHSFTIASVQSEMSPFVSDRSYLFVPGNRPDRFESASHASADVVLIDMEDAVAPADKAAARQSAKAWLGSRPAWLRINGVDSDEFEADLALLSNPFLQGVMLAKAESPGAIGRVRSAVPEGLPVIPLIESAQGMWHAMALASAPGVLRLAFGAVDYQLDLGIDGGCEELLSARSHLVLVSRVAGLLPPLDGVTMTLDDAEALRRDVAYARRLGFGGKLCVHPRQVAAINEGFLPSESEVEWAQRVVTAASQSGENALRLDGKLVDRPVIERARAILRAESRRSR
jgi:citrate lyase subunit beta / citryl-CoA lyase